MTENATSTDMNTPATSLTDKERELIAQMPYEEARDKLIQAVQALETGGLNLDQSMRQWEIGEALAKRPGSAQRRPCQARPSTSRASRQRSHRRHAVQPRLSCLPARHPAARTRVRTGLSSASRHTIVVIRPHWQQFIEGKSHVNVDSCIPSAS